MWRSMLKVMAATAAFGLVHSALASRRAKQAAADHFGERNRNGLDRRRSRAEQVGGSGTQAATAG